MNMTEDFPLKDGEQTDAVDTPRFILGNEKDTEGQLLLPIIEELNRGHSPSVGWE